MPICLKRGKMYLETKLLGKQVTVLVNKPLGFKDSRTDITYPLNYGFIPGFYSANGSELNAYVLGVSEPIARYEGIAIAIIIHEDDIQNKLVVTKQLKQFTREKIYEAIHFQEKKFKIKIIYFDDSKFVTTIINPTKSKYHTIKLPQPPSDKSCNLEIQTTTSCNAYCLFCPHVKSWKKVKPQKMKESNFVQIIEALSKYRFYKVAPFLQNEPLTDPRIFRFIKMISKMLNFDVIEVSTNPGILDPNKASKLIEALHEIPHEIRLSFHGIDKRTFEGNMGISYVKSVSNTVHFLKKATNAGMNILINALGEAKNQTKKNQNDFSPERCLDFWEKLCMQNKIDFGKIRVRCRTYHNRCNNNQPLMKDQLTPQIHNALNGLHCARVLRWFHVLYNGNMILCCNDYYGETIFGNILKNPLVEIFQSKDYQTLLDKVNGKQSSSINFICKRCIAPDKRDVSRQ
jgi:inorganic pyrophosphatase/MoaA/NifB/PqqE/SkfB family radical SAM enzyme